MKIQIGDEVRNMTADEKANHDAVIAEQNKSIEQIKNVEQARASALSKLEALGLTPAEISALV